jgi:cytochrome c peroxidase
MPSCHTPVSGVFATAVARAIPQRPFALVALVSALALTACGGGDEALQTEAALAAASPAATETVPAGVVIELEAPQAVGIPQAQLIQLGRALFADRNLSEPAGTACSACHQPNAGFAGNNASGIGIAQGSRPGVFGHRNSLTNSYQGLVPPFGFVTRNGRTEPRGGHFWDGRVDAVAVQALQPFLNPLEMNNPSKQAVVNKVAAAPYADLFRRAFGANVFSNVDAAFSQIGVAIEAFERGALQPFNSKYDAMVRGQATLSAAESRGLALFQDRNRANCVACHVMNPGTGRPEDSPFSDFSYVATGVPRNLASPANADPAFFDLGLCGPDRTAPGLPANAVGGVTPESLCGKFRVPTLRNVAQRPAYMHNGVFRDLTEVVRFYSTRNSNPRRWYGPAGVPNDLPQAYLANVESARPPFNRRASDGPVLTDAEVADLVAFLRTLSDGFAPTPPAAP